MSKQYKRELRNLISNVQSPWDRFKRWMAQLLTATGGSPRSGPIPSRLTKTREMTDGYRTLREHPSKERTNQGSKGGGQDPGEDASPRNQGRSNGKGVQGISKNRKKEVTMLKKSTSEKAFKQNIKTEVKSGKPVKQAVAIAYAVKREAKKGTKGKK